MRPTLGPAATSSLDLSGLNGPLDARNGIVGATSSIGVLYGGTGSTTLSGIPKGNGTGAVQTAIADTDYATPATILSLKDRGIVNSALSPTTTLRLAFTQASSTQQSILDGLFVGRTSTTTIRADGLASILPYPNQCVGATIKKAPPIKARLPLMNWQRLLGNGCVGGRIGYSRTVRPAEVVAEQEKARDS
jgi:hypothetical protein